MFVETGCLKSSGIGARLGLDGGGKGSSSAPIWGTGIDITPEGGRIGLFSSFSSSSSLNPGERGTSSFFCGRNGNEPVNVNGFAVAFNPLSFAIGGLAGAEWRSIVFSPGGGKRKDVIVFTPSSSEPSKSTLDRRCRFSRP